MRVWIFRKITVIASIVMAYFLQFTFLKYIKIGYALPNLLVACVGIIGFVMGTEEGFLAGIVAGLLMDSMFSEYIGIYAIIYITIGYISGVLAKIYYGNAKVVMYTLVFAEEILYGLYIYVVFFLLRGRLYIFTYFYKNILPSSIYTLLFSFLLGGIIVKINDKFIKLKRRRDNYFAELDT